MGFRWILTYFLVFSGTLVATPSPFLTLEDVIERKSVEIRIDPTKKATVLVFLSSTCPCSESHEPVLKQLASKYPHVAFFGVAANSDEDSAELKSHFQKAGLPFPVLHDKEQKLADKLGALKTPHAFVFTPDLESPVYRGGVDNSHDAPRASVHHLSAALDAISLGKKPETREARVLGCAISR